MEPSFHQQLSEPMSSEAYARALHNTALADGTFVPLLIRLEHVIEHNVSTPRLSRSEPYATGEVMQKARRKRCVEPEASERGHKNHGRAIDRGDANRSGLFVRG